MREILFRGKRKDNNEWAYGCLYETSVIYHKIPKFYILPKTILYRIWADGDLLHSVYSAYIIKDKDTIGQYIGVMDKNNTKIFEGDIIKDINTPIHGLYIVADMDKEQQLYYKDTRYGWVSKSIINFSNLDSRTIEVIGNIYDNPDLLK